MVAMRRVFAPCVLMIGAALVAAPARAQRETHTVTRPVTRESRPVRVLRSWEETVKAAGRGEYTRRVEVVFDYEKGVARQNYYSTDGLLYDSREIKQNMPAPSAEEIAEAQDLILRDAELSRIVARRAAVFEGGFILEEGRGFPCGPGSRCLQVQLLTPDHSGLIRWTVVDLVKRQIAYPVFVPKGANP